MGTTRHGESHTYELKSVDAIVSPDRHAGDVGGGRGRRGPGDRGPRAGRPRRPAPLRGRSRPDPQRVRAADRAGPAGQTVDRGPQQEGPLSRRRPGGDPGEAPRAARRRDRSGRHRGRRRRSPAHARPRCSGPTARSRRSSRSRSPTSPPSGRGSARSSAARASSCTRPTCWCGAGCSSRRPRSSSPASGIARPWRWSNITSGSPPERSSPTRFPPSTSWPGGPCSST